MSTPLPLELVLPSKVVRDGTADLPPLYLKKCTTIAHKHRTVSIFCFLIVPRSACTCLSCHTSFHHRILSQRVNACRVHASPERHRSDRLSIDSSMHPPSQYIPRLPGCMGKKEMDILEKKNIEQGRQRCRSSSEDRQKLTGLDLMGLHNSDQWAYTLPLPILASLALWRCGKEQQRTTKTKGRETNGAWES